MPYTLNDLLHQYPKYEKLAEEAEELRKEVDVTRLDSSEDALELLIQVDTKMLELLNYHMQLSSACLRHSIPGLR